MEIHCHYYHRYEDKNKNLVKLEEIEIDGAFDHSFVPSTVSLFTAMAMI